VVGKYFANLRLAGGSYSSDILSLQNLETVLPIRTEVVKEVKTPPKKRAREEPLMFKGAAAKGVAKKVVKGANAALDEEAVDALFNSLADEDDPECINMDGIGSFCEMLEMDPSTDVRLLVLLWKMAAVSKPGTVTRKEFTTGMLTTFKKDSAEGLKSILSTLDPGFLERGPFREFYRYVFQFSREGKLNFGILMLRLKLC
jgi:hypothetical protein